MTVEEKKEKNLSLDDKLDKIMEVLLFQQHMLLGAIKAMDDILAKREAPTSKIWKP